MERQQILAFLPALRDSMGQVHGLHGSGEEMLVEGRE
jgi:hypothetical protein